MELYRARELRGKVMQRIIRTSQIVGVVVRYPVGVFIPCLNEEGKLDDGKLAAMGASGETINWLRRMIENEKPNP